MENVNCCGNGPHSAGEVRVMRLAGDGNLILCSRCWNAELKYRAMRNQQLGDFAQFDLPAWNTAKVYGVEP